MITLWPMVNLKISKNMVTKIDRSTYVKLKKAGLLKWNAQKVGKKHYASRNIGDQKVYLHRWILEAPAGLVTDHIDRDPLNNTKKNLRLCFHRDNARNKDNYKNDSTTTKYKGVCFLKKGASYIAQLQFGGNNLRLGAFDRPEDAAKVYDMMSVICFGKFASPNFDLAWRFLKLRNQLIKELK